MLAIAVRVEPGVKREPADTEDADDDAFGSVPAWHELRNEKGELYFWYSLTGETAWDAPPWSLEVDTVSGHEYYLHAPTGESRWERPAAYVPVVREGDNNRG